MNTEWNNGSLGENNDLASISTSRTWEWIGVNTGKCFLLPTKECWQRILIKIAAFSLFLFFSWTGDACDTMFASVYWASWAAVAMILYPEWAWGNKCVQFVSAGAGKQMFQFAPYGGMRGKETSVISVTVPVKPHFNPVSEVVSVMTETHFLHVDEILWQV